MRRVALLALTLASAVPAGAVQVPGGTPVQITKAIVVTTGAAGTVTLFTVPEGKALRLEHASCFANTYGGTNLARCRLSVTSAGTVFPLDLVVSDAGPMGNGFGVGPGRAYVASGPVTLRAAAGDSVLAFVVRGGNISTAPSLLADVSIVGVLEDVPTPPE